MEAVLELGEGGKRGWYEARDKDGFPYHRRELSTADERSFVVAVAWSGEMGETAAATRAKGLIDELTPSCLAMCGICAGRRHDVFLGDVIVADRVYSYDHGKLIERDDKGHEVEFFHDIETYNLDKAWKMHAAFLAREPAWRSSLEKGVLQGHKASVESVTFAPDGLTLASASDDTTITLWNVATGKALRVLQGHKDYVRSVAFAPDGLTLASASDDKTVTLWSVTLGKALHVLEGHTASVRSVAFARRECAASLVRRSGCGR